MEDSEDSLLGFSYFAKAARGTQRSILLTRLRVIMKGYNSGTVRWKRCTGQSIGKGGRASMPSPAAMLLKFPRVHQPRNLQTPFSCVFCRGLIVRGTSDQNRLPWPGMIVATCMSYLTTGGPGKEHGTNKLPPTGRIRERSKGERIQTPVRMSYQPPRILLAGIHLGWAMHMPPGRTLSQNDRPETTWKLTPSP